MKNTLLGLLFTLLILPLNGRAQVDENSDLFQTLRIQDSLFFERSFNRCDMEYLEKAISPDLRFYHDTGGYQDRDNFLKNTRENLCGDMANKPIRKLKEGTLQVFPLYDNGQLYGAIQKGVHDFYIRRNDKPDEWTGTAPFTSVWVLDGASRWILKEVLSYDHSGPLQAPPGMDDAYIEHLMEEHKIPALGLAILQEGKLRETKVFGEIYEGQAAGVDAIFNVASLTKPVVSMLSLKLAAEGYWDLDQPIYPYWTDPDVKEDPRSRKLTTRHILSHQSGFPNWRWEDPSGKLKFGYTPGEGFGYSGEGFEYLKHALENKFERSISQLADSLLFQPLQMHNTSFTWNEYVKDENFARWHDAEGFNTYPTDKTHGASGADNLLTTIGDYGRFAQYVLEKVAEPEGLYREMVQKQNGSGSNDMGLGWELLKGLKGEEYAILHTGGDKGVQTLVMLLPETGEGIVIFTNADRGNRLFFPLVEYYLSLGKEINDGAP